MSNNIARGVQTLLIERKLFTDSSTYLTYGLDLFSVLMVVFGPCPG